MSHAPAMLSPSSPNDPSRKGHCLPVVLRAAKLCILTIFWLSFVISGWSQGDPAAGILPFSTRLEGSIDQVDLATSNIFIRIPVKSKTGAIPFSYSLVSNSHAWLAQNGTVKFWNVSDGFAGVQEWPAAHLTSWLNPEAYTCNENRGDQLWNQAVVDSTGASHPLSVVTDTFGCIPLPQNAVTTDGSGYTANFTAYNAATIYDRSGNKSSGTGRNGAVSDPDGNEITSTYLAPTLTFNDTLGTLALAGSTGSGGGGSPFSYQYTDAAGKTQTVEVNLSPYTQAAAFGSCGGITPTAVYLPSSISIPSGGQYSIYYEGTSGNPPDVTGRISQITFPSGGYVSYSYGSNSPLNCNSGTVPTLKRTVYDSFSKTTSTWTYVNTNNSVGAAVYYTVTVTDPSNNQTVYNFAGGYQTQAMSYEGGCPTTISGCSGGGALLRTVTTCYNGNFASCVTPSHFPGGQITQTDLYTSFNSSPSNLVETKFDTYGNVAEVKQYDFGVAMGAPPTVNPLSDTVTYYGQSWNGTSCTAYSSGYIRNTPCYSHTMNSSLADVTKTQITYSGTGHPTSTAKWTSGSSWLTSTATYSPTNGTMTTGTDVNGALFTYAYNGTGGCNGLLPTSVTVTGASLPSGGLTTSTQWDCNGGVAILTKDANGQPTTANYVVNGTADPLYRPLSIVDSLIPANTATLSYSTTTIESAMNFNGTTSTSDALATVDGIGRQIFSQKRQAQGSSNFDSTQTTYGWTTTGPFTTASMPYTGTAGQSAPSGTAVTTTQYDAMGRRLTVTDGGGGTASYTYVKNDVLQSVGPTQTFQRQLEYDGLGRVTSVCEMSSTLSGIGTCGQTNSVLGYWTRYKYDALGNLIGVCENTTQPLTVDCVQTPSAGQQTRIYTYDGLNRLTSESNPESGTTSYVFDSESACGPNGAYASNGDLLQKTNARGLTTCNYYDGLHRLTDVGNNSQSTTNFCKRFRYDSPSNGFVSQPPGATFTDTTGRLVEAETDYGSMITDEWFSYDNDGHMTDIWESTPHSGTYYHAVSTFAGNGVPLTVQLANPSLYTMTYGLDAEGRAASLKGGSTTVVAGTTFNASSQPTYIDLGMGTDQSDYIYDPKSGRMTNWTFKVGSGSETGALTWNANGTLGKLAIVDGFNTAGSQTCTFGTSTVAGYDDLGRLLSDNCGSVWAQTFSYDPYGNLTKSGSINWNPGYNPANNHYSTGASYDNSGNLTYDTIHLYTWDAYGKLSSIDSSACGTNGECVTYDAFGNAVETSYDGVYTEIWYTQLGKTVYMKGSSPYYAYWPTPGNGTVEVNGNAVTFYYMHKDWLGSARISSVIVNPAVISDQAVAPFGEVYNKLATGAGVPAQMFTGNTQDIIGGIFDTPNRELNASQGRWISPDPSGLSAVDSSNPQTWNRYAYVLNNPLSYTDPLGLFCVWDNGSYDSNDDPNTGNKSACEDGNGGTWFNGSPSDWSPGAGDWSGQASGTFAGWAQGINPSVGDFGDPTGVPDASAFGTFTPVATTTSSLPGQISLGCMLQAPSGSYTLGSNAVALFQPPMTNALNAAFGNLNSQGVVPMITSGFRTAADQQRMLQGASGPNPAAAVSWHQAGMAVDFNTMGGNFGAIKAAMTAQGLTWGGTFRRPDPVHFQLPAAGTRPTAAMVSACGGG